MEYERLSVELFNTSIELATELCERVESHIKDTIIYDPCADLGNILEAAKSMGYEVKGGDCNPSPHAQVEQKDLFDIDTSLDGYSIITIFRWGDFEGTTAERMIRHLAALQPNFIMTTKCPSRLKDISIDGYELVFHNIISHDRYVRLEGGIIDTGRTYNACGWKRIEPV
ncbi:hypothetical protein NVP1081O_256 [Vibrio phage 1.081.O._10N.286.52.C2]|nr:hypothetical protein NVP1081O_256 [Vibrio phage 1.081.O._10N.286.52.C2]